jgi:hypothetical protein
MTIQTANYAKAVPTWVVTDNYNFGVSVNGVISANYFVGSGFYLTSLNVDAMTIQTANYAKAVPTWVVTDNYYFGVSVNGVISANSFVGSGSGLYGSAINLTAQTSNIAISINALGLMGAIQVATGNLAVYVSQNGYVGIGTSNPIANLHVIGTINATAFVGAASGMTVGTSNIAVSMNALGLLGAIRASTGNLAIYVSSNGFVGIGTSNPTVNLHVIGTVNATAFVGDGSRLSNLPSGTLTNNYNGDVNVNGTISANRFLGGETYYVFNAYGALQVSNNVAGKLMIQRPGTIVSINAFIDNGSASQISVNYSPNISFSAPVAVGGIMDFTSQVVSQNVNATVSQGGFLRVGCSVAGTGGYLTVIVKAKNL